MPAATKTTAARLGFELGAMVWRAVWLIRTSATRRVQRWLWPRLGWPELAGSELAAAPEFGNMRARGCDALGGRLAAELASWGHHEHV